jgi:PIN domain
VSSTALLDASVLYPSTVRSVLMFLAAFGMFRPLWSDDVHREWIAALVRDRPDLGTDRITRTRALMEAHVPSATVTGYQRRIAELVLPDANDRHVLAAALHGNARCDRGVYHGYIEESRVSGQISEISPEKQTLRRAGRQRAAVASTMGITSALWPA